MFYTTQLYCSGFSRQLRRHGCYPTMAILHEKGREARSSAHSEAGCLPLRSRRASEGRPRGFLGSRWSSVHIGSLQKPGSYTSRGINSSSNREMNLAQTQSFPSSVRCHQKVLPTARASLPTSNNRMEQILSGAPAACLPSR